MSENKHENLLSTRDLGDGRVEATFRVNSAELLSYLSEQAGKPNLPGDLQLGTGSVRSRYDATQYKNFYSLTSDEIPFTQAMKTPADPHKKIQLAVDLYFKEPTIGTVIDLMVDFSASGFTNECEDAEVKKFYDKWGKEIRLEEVIEGIFLEYYRSGNVTVYRSERNAKVKKSVTSKSQTETKTYSFPAGYTILNPMNVYVEGSLLFNQEIIKLKLNEELINYIKDTSTPRSVLSQLPTSFIKAVRSGNTQVVLDPALTTRITRKKQPYERYASPFLERVFGPALFKQKLRMMDMSTVEGLINQLVTVTVGDKDFPATTDDIEAIAELFQTPNKAYTIFWNHTLKVTFHKPEGLDTLASDKYKQVDDDILAGIGVSRVLLDGQGANFSTAWVSILSLIERLENARSKVKNWLEAEYQRIAEENGFKAVPVVRFNRMNLREDTYIRDVLLAMYDRGLIDEEDILVETGRDYDAVVEMKKRNEKNSELFLPPEQPFQGGNSSPNNGRPDGGGGNYSKRKTGPVQNEGNAPKSRKSQASAFNHRKLEDYEEELQNHYANILSKLKDSISALETMDQESRDAFLVGTIFAMFQSISQTGKQVINEAFDDEFSRYQNNLDQSARKVKAEIIDWNTSYVLKLASDIRDQILEREGNLGLEKAIDKAFEANRYRIDMMSSAGLIEATRQAKIQGSMRDGAQRAIWISALADQTCNTCRGLHGQEFDISNIPPRPHANCQCDLEFL